MSGYQIVSIMGSSVERTIEIINSFQADQVLTMDRRKGAHKEAARAIRNPE
jgi:hypothetical protein